MSEKLKNIEDELHNYVAQDQRSWSRIYTLMNTVETEQLYKERTDTPSFTSWVNAIADEMHVHVSLLWARLKAGRSYTEYVERAEKAGRSVVPLADIAVSPDSLNLCEKVAGKNAAEMDYLIEKTVKGDLTRDDLRAAARAKRASGDTMPKSRYDRISAEDRTDAGEAKVTAADIILALKRPDWLTIAREDKYFDHIYHVFTEFRAESGSATHTRRMDALIAETVTEAERDHVTLRGIEIKVNKHDLLMDTKMEEYTAFCDYFYIAIPDRDAELLEAAKAVKRPAWGILLVDKAGKITIAAKPEQLNPVFRDKTLTNCIIKLA